jgi:hypothetical protein
LPLDWQILIISTLLRLTALFRFFIFVLLYDLALLVLFVLGEGCHWVEIRFL